MTQRREGERSQYWKRVEVVMQVQQGKMTVREAARVLGLSPRHYYRLEEEMLKASLDAVTPKKRGRKKTKPKKDWPGIKLRRRAEKHARDKEILKLKIKELEETVEAMRKAGLKAGREKKRRRKRRNPGSRPEVQ